MDVRAVVILGVTAVLASAGAAARAQEGQVGTDQPPSLTLGAPAVAPFGDPVGVSAETVNAPGLLTIRLQRVQCSRIAGPIVARMQTPGGGFGMGDEIIPRRRIRYRLCARLRTADGAILRSERPLTIR